VKIYTQRKILIRYDDHFDEIHYKSSLDTKSIRII